MKKLNKSISIGLLSTLAVASPVVVAVSCGSTPDVPVTDVEFSWNNVSVLFGGINGQGRAEVRAPEIDGIKYELSKDNHLNLGEKVIVSAVADGSHSINGKDKETKEFTVQGLTPNVVNKNINISQDQLNVTFSGVDGSGKAVVNAIYPGITFQASDNSLSNGESVTIKAIAKPGYTINWQNEVSYTYQVSGLPTTQQTINNNINLNIENVLAGEFTGWNGLGVFNWSALENTDMYSVSDPIFINGSENGKLKNGDRVSVSITPNAGKTINGSNQSITKIFTASGLEDAPTQDLQLDQDDFFFEYYWSGNELKAQIQCTTWFVTIEPTWPTGGITEGSTITLDLIPDFGFTINGKAREQLTFTATNLPNKPPLIGNSITRDSFGIAFPGVDGLRTATVVKKPEGVNISLDKTENLSTGDIVTLTATWTDRQSNQHTESFQYMVTEPSLYDFIEDNEPVTYEWDANNSHTWLDSIYVRDAQFGIFFPKPFAEMTPWDFGMYLVNMYNRAGSGVMHLTMEFKGHTDTVDVDFKQPLLDLISTFSKAEITPLTPRSTTGMMGRVFEMDPSALVGMMSSAPDLLKMVLDYGYDMFFPSLDGNHGPITGTTSEKTAELMSLATRILGGESRVMNEMFPFIAPFPDETLAAFGNLAAIFTEMTKGFADSEVAHSWANAQTQKEVDELGTRENCTMANTYIRLVMLQGIGEI